ncbi:probable E3 ubiquitin-protein ligase XERICO [Ricinus communis]|uniref:Protein binding protein, putative n=1 Tax=Ricinus communis TaxID=3988 RepID=B9SVL9_RICCO|nr:probable E3 ubiquitin-protein ligase XERICO [Ricinus communis]EEF32338.1 protein binding protein, putative [Ricinus communis]|eukprot:XP_002530038.1 probable E3 ubiquitin-protein ligase XERICO [Ricinus communis]
MGLSSFPSAAEGVLPVLVMNTVLSVALFKNWVRALLQVVMGANYWVPQYYYEQDRPDVFSQDNARRERRISITQFKSMGAAIGTSRSSSSTVECCVCLCGFEEDEEVSELSCKHFFHKGCLDKWFDNKHSTCPLCRSIL